MYDKKFIQNCFYYIEYMEPSPSKPKQDNLELLHIYVYFTVHTSFKNLL